jgi:hypothetical protein
MAAVIAAENRGGTSRLFSTPSTKQTGDWKDVNPSEPHHSFDKIKVE